MSQITSLAFNIEDAKKYGQEEAVILYHIRYWVRTNAANNKHIYEGRHWTYNSHKSLSELFPFWNEQKCKRLIASLKEQGAILVGNFNKMKYDRTSWYTLNDDSTTSQKQSVIQSELNEASVNNDRPIPITTITNNHDLQTSHSAKACSVKKNSFKDKGNKTPLKKPAYTPEEISALLQMSSNWYQWLIAKHGKICSHFSTLSFDERAWWANEYRMGCDKEKFIDSYLRHYSLISGLSSSDIEIDLSLT